MFSFAQCLCFGEAWRATAPSGSHTEDPASASVNWLSEPLDVSAVPIRSQMSQAPAVSDRDFSASARVGRPVKPLSAADYFRVATSCGVIPSHREMGHVFRAPGKGHLEA